MEITALQMKQAGFDDEAIIGFIEEQRAGMVAAGFTHQDINTAYGLTVIDSPSISNSLVSDDGINSDGLVVEKPKTVTVTSNEKEIIVDPDASVVSQLVDPLIEIDSNLPVTENGTVALENAEQKAIKPVALTEEELLTQAELETKADITRTNNGSLLSIEAQNALALATGGQTDADKNRDRILNERTIANPLEPKTKAMLDEVPVVDRQRIATQMAAIGKMVYSVDGKNVIRENWLAENYPEVTPADANVILQSELALYEHAENSLRAGHRTGRYKVAGKVYNRKEFMKRFPNFNSEDHEEIDLDFDVKAMNTVSSTLKESQLVLNAMGAKHGIDKIGLAHINELVSFFAGIETSSRSIYNEKGTKTGHWQFSVDQTRQAANAYYKIISDNNEVHPDWLHQLYAHGDMTRLDVDQQRALTLAYMFDRKRANGEDVNTIELLKSVANRDPMANATAYFDIFRDDRYEIEVVNGKEKLVRKLNPELDARVLKYLDALNVGEYDYESPEIAVFAHDTVVSDLPFGDYVISLFGGKGHQNIFTNGYLQSMNGSIEAFNSALINGEEPKEAYRKIFMNQDMSFTKTVVQDMAMLMNDVPWYAAVGGACFLAGSATVGTAGAAGVALPLVCGGAAMALPDGIRDAYSRALRNDEVDNIEDFLTNYFDKKTAVVMAKSTVIGTATMGAGLAVSSVSKSTLARLTAETATMTIMAQALEGQIPSMKDFAHSAILIGGVHSTIKMGGKGIKSVNDVMHDIYAKYSLHPRDVAQLAATNTLFREQILRGEIPDLLVETAANVVAKMEAKNGAVPIIKTQFQTNMVVETSVSGTQKGVVVAIEAVGEKNVLKVQTPEGIIKVDEANARPANETKLTVRVDTDGVVQATRTDLTAVEKGQGRGTVSLDWTAINPAKRVISDAKKAIVAIETGLGEVVRLGTRTGEAVSNGTVAVVSKYYPKVIEAFSSVNAKVVQRVTKADTVAQVLNNPVGEGVKLKTGSATVVTPRATIKANGELGYTIDTMVVEVKGRLIAVPLEAYNALKNFTNEIGREAGAKVVAQGDTVIFVHPKTNTIMASLKGEKVKGNAKDQAEGFSREQDAYRANEARQSRTDPNWAMPKDPKMPVKPLFTEKDTPFLQLFNTAKGVDMMDLVNIVRKHIDNVPVMEGMTGGLRGYFQFNNKGKAKDTKIAINEALARDPEGFLMTMAHEIGHMLDFIAKDSVTMKRGNILGSLASMKGFMNDWIDGKNDGAKPFSKVEIAAFRKAAEIEAAKQEPVVDADLATTFKGTGLEITPQTIMDIFKTTNAREVINKEFYEAFVSMSGPLKKLVIRDAVKGIMHKDLKALADRINNEAATDPSVKVGLSEKGLLNAEAIFKRNFEKAIKESGLVDKQIITAELRAASMKWKPFERQEGSKYTKYRDNPRELMADFLMAWLLRPQWVRLNAPKTYEMWAYHMDKKPELQKMWSDIQNELAAGPKGRNHAGIKSVYDMIDRSQERKLSALDSEILNFKSKVTGSFDKLGIEFVDTFTWMFRRVHGPNGGQKYHSSQSENLLIRAEKYRYRHAMLKRYNEEMVIQVIKPLENLGYNAKDLGVYLYLNNLAKSSQREGVANPLGAMSMTPEMKAYLKENGERSVEDMLLHFNETKPQIAEAATKFYAVRERMILPLIKESGMFDQKTIDIIANNQEYIHFSVTDYLVQRLEKYGPNAAVSKSLKGTKFGTFKDIDNPFMSTIEKDLMLIMETKRQRLISDTVDWMKANKDWLETFNQLKDVNGKAILEPVIHFPKRTGANTYEGPAQGMMAVTYISKGKTKTVHIVKDMAEAFFHDPSGFNTVSRILELTATPFKKVFTEYNPTFWPMNLARDSFRAVRNMEGARFIDPLRGGQRSYIKYLFMAMPEAARSIFGEGTVRTRKMEEDGFLISMEDGYRGQSGAMARLRNLSPDDVQIELLLAKHQKDGTFQKLWNNSFGAFFNGLGNIARVFERMPKIAGKRYLEDAIARGDITMSEGQQMLKIQGEVGSPNFLRTAKLHGLTNNLFIYSNAMAQGWRADGSAFMKNKRSVGTKYVAYTVMPKIAQIGAQAGLMGLAYSALFDGVSEWDKTNYIVMPLGKTPDGRVVYFRMPQDESARVINGVLVKSFNAMTEESLGHKNKASGMFEYISGNGLSLNPIFDFVIDSFAIISGKNPTDSFRNSPALSQTQQTAGGSRRIKELGKYMWNSNGGQAIYQFKTGNAKEIAGELEKILQVPITGRMINRFLKIGNQPEMKEVREQLAAYEMDEANVTLDYQEAIKHLIEGTVDELTEKQTMALALRSDRLKQDTSLIASLAGKAGASQFIQAFIEEDTKVKKVIMLKAFIDSQK